MKRLRKQDKFLVGFETRIKRRERNFIYSALRNKRKLDVKDLYNVTSYVCDYCQGTCVNMYAWCQLMMCSYS